MVLPYKTQSMLFLNLLKDKNNVSELQKKKKLSRFYPQDKIHCQGAAAYLEIANWYYAYRCDIFYNLVFND
jgi:hypothetical protein